MLPSRPNLEYLRKLAKERLKESRREDPSARLADAQLVVAREHGFASWRKLRAHLDRVRSAADPSPEPAWPEALMEEFFGAIKRGDETALQRMLVTPTGPRRSSPPRRRATPASSSFCWAGARTASGSTRTRPTRRCRGR